LCNSDPKPCACATSRRTSSGARRIRGSHGHRRSGGCRRTRRLGGPGIRRRWCRHDRRRRQWRSSSGNLGGADGLYSCALSFKLTPSIRTSPMLTCLPPPLRCCVPALALHDSSALAAAWWALGGGSGSLMWTNEMMMARCGRGSGNERHWTRQLGSALNCGSGRHDGRAPGAVCLGLGR
jgi:hypothetical protein